MPATKSAAAAIAVALLAAPAEVWLAVQTTAASAPEGSLSLLVAFLAGPLLFAALLAWMRRRHVTRSRFLLVLTAVVAAVGLAVLGNDFYRFATEPPERRTPHSNPVLLPLFQWFAVLAAWVGLGVVESREKRLAKAKPPA